MKNRLYIAYGSNLNFRQMKYRCPSAKFLGAGVLKDYELQFKGSSIHSFATIGQKEGEAVPVGVWKLQHKDEAALDLYEGYPSHYYKRNIPVELNGEEVNAMVYIMNPRMQYGLPSLQYYRTLVEGYRDCGLDLKVLQKALQDSTLQYYSLAVGPDLSENRFEQEEEAMQEDDGQQMSM